MKNDFLSAKDGLHFSITDSTAVGLVLFLACLRRSVMRDCSKTLVYANGAHFLPSLDLSKATIWQFITRILPNFYLLLPPNCCLDQRCRLLWNYSYHRIKSASFRTSSCGSLTQLPITLGHFLRNGGLSVRVQDNTVNEYPKYLSVLIYSFII